MIPRKKKNKRNSIVKVRVLGSRFTLGGYAAMREKSSRGHDSIVDSLRARKRSHGSRARKESASLICFQLRDELSCDPRRTLRRTCPAFLRVERESIISKRQRASFRSRHVFGVIYSSDLGAEVTKFWADRVDGAMGICHSHSSC